MHVTPCFSCVYFPRLSVELCCKEVWAPCSFPNPWSCYSVRLNVWASTNEPHTWKLAGYKHTGGWDWTGITNAFTSSALTTCRSRWCQRLLVQVGQCDDVWWSFRTVQEVLLTNPTLLNFHARPSCTYVFLYFFGGNIKTLFDFSGGQTQISTLNSFAQAWCVCSSNAFSVCTNRPWQSELELQTHRWMLQVLAPCKYLFDPGETVGECLREVRRQRDRLKKRSYQWVINSLKAELCKLCLSCITFYEPPEREAQAQKVRSDFIQSCINH